MRHYLITRFYNELLLNKRYNHGVTSDAETQPGNQQDMAELVATLQTKLDHQALFIEQLLEQIRLAQHNRFCVKSEAVSPDQLRFLLGDGDVSEEIPDDADSDEPTEKNCAARAPKAKRGRRALPSHLPRIEIKHTLDEDACQCEHCQQRMVPLSEKITEPLDIVPAKIRVLRHHRQTYHCPDCSDELKTAPLTPQPIPKSNAAPSLLAYLIIAKYLDGMCRCTAWRESLRATACH